MRPNLLIIAGLLIAASALGGCASIVEGTDQNVRVNLSPENATCAVLRDGEQVASVSRTNKSFKVSKSKNSLDIECKAPGHLPESLSIESAASGWGVVGCIFIDLCITDYSTGALNKYPTQITVALTPESFRSETERSDWIRARKREIESRFSRVKRDAAELCAENDQDKCDAQVAKLEEQKRAALERLDTQISSTRVSMGTPSTANASSTEDRLQTLKSLYDRGLINKKEYDQKRNEIMSGL